MLRWMSLMGTVVLFLLFTSFAMVAGCGPGGEPSDEAVPGGSPAPADRGAAGPGAPAGEAPAGAEEAGSAPESESAGQPLKKAELLIQLPGELCNTPDAMTLLPDGSVIVSIPNFNDLEAGSFLARITPDNQFEKFLDLPVHPETGQPFGPLGLCTTPSGDLFVADFQQQGDRQSRVVRIHMENGRPVEAVPVITGFHVSNAVIVRGGHLYVSETQIDTEVRPAISGVFRFSLEQLEDTIVQLAENELDDPHLIATIETHNEELPLGADGLAFDDEGNLYIGNFSDGTVHRLQFDAEGKVIRNEIFAQADFMKSADGLFRDPQTGVIYVADSKANAVQMVFPDGSVRTLAQNGDTDGLDGGMDQPCEVLLRGRELIVSNMDWPVPGCVNQTYNAPCTLSVIRLD